jgi:hypothetical protein
MRFFTRLFSKYISRACGATFYALFTNPQTKPRALKTASTPPNPPPTSQKKLKLRGSMSNMQLGVSA